MSDVQPSFPNHKASAAGRGVAGLSMGGYGALKLGLKSTRRCSPSPPRPPARSTRLLAPMTRLSCRVFGEPGSAVRTENDLPRLAREFPEERKGSLPFLYLDCGEKDLWFAANREFAGILSERKLAYRVQAGSRRPRLALLGEVQELCARRPNLLASARKLERRLRGGAGQYTTAGGGRLFWRHGPPLPRGVLTCIFRVLAAFELEPRPP